MYRSPVEWKFQSINNTHLELVFNGYNILNRESGTFIINDTEGGFNLLKSRSQLKDAGAYHCIKRIQQQQSIRTEISIAQLTILGKHPLDEIQPSTKLKRLWFIIDLLRNINPY